MNSDVRDSGDGEEEEVKQISECQTKLGTRKTVKAFKTFTLIHSLLTCRTTFVFMSMLKSHSLPLILFHNFHSLIHFLDMLNIPCLCVLKGPTGTGTAVPTFRTRTSCKVLLK